MLDKSPPSDQVTFEAAPFPYLCIDDFLTKDECAALIQDATDTNSEDTVFMHEGRLSLSSVSPTFKGLVAKSESWTRLVTTLQSDTTANLFLSYIRKECSNKFFTKWVTSKKFEISEIPKLTSVLPQFIVDKVKSASNRQARFCTNKQLFFLSFMGLFDDIYRIMHSFGSYIVGKRRLALLFDYSVAKKGYTREIHRDSDARVIVFLLYLNDLEDYVEGGRLKIYNSKVEQEKYAPRPGDDNVYVVNEFKPKAGRLVMFLNTSNSYHSVEKMTNTEYGRHFLYGAYTLSSGFGSLAKIKSSGKLPTEYNLYRE